MTTPLTVLVNGESRCTLVPSLGGSIGSWTIAGQPMLRAAQPEATDRANPLALACFPLIPYSNRIANATFRWNGEDIQLAPNYAPELHAIHGVGWQRQWLIADASAASATLVLNHEPDADWPWAFEASQTFILGPASLDIVVRSRNLAKEKVPLAFGLHPYFDAAGATMQFEADHVWMVGEDGLPSTPVVPTGPFSFATPEVVSGRNIDHCYAGVRGAARMTWSGRPLALELSSSPQMEAAVVYIPKGGDTFCFEPVPHINNALHLPDHTPAMPIVDAGGVSETKISLKAVRL